MHSAFARLSWKPHTQEAATYRYFNRFNFWSTLPLLLISIIDVRKHFYPWNGCCSRCRDWLKHKYSHPCVNGAYESTWPGGPRLVEKLPPRLPTPSDPKSRVSWILCSSSVASSTSVCCLEECTRGQVLGHHGACHSGFLFCYCVLIKICACNRVQSETYFHQNKVPGKRLNKEGK